MTPSEKIKLYYDSFNSLANRILGAGNSEGKALTTGVLLMMCFGLVFEVMHINGIYQNRSEFLQIISSLMIYVLIIQILAFVANRFLGRDFVPIAAAHSIAKNFFAKEEKIGDNISVLNSTVDRAFFILKCYIPINFAFYHTGVITSWIMSIWEQRYIMAFQVYLPRTNPNTLNGYLLNVALQTFGSSMVSIIYVLRDIHIIFYPLQTIAMVEVLVLKMEKFSRDLKRFRLNKQSLNEMSALPVQFTNRMKLQGSNAKAFLKNKRKKERETIERKFIEIIKEYETYNIYIAHNVTFITPSAFTALLTNSIAIGLSLLYTRLVSIPVGIAFFAVFLYQVILPCIVGTFVSSQNEKLLKAICAFPWLELSPKMRKIYLQFIHECQHTNQIELPIIGTINMELFTKVMNASYSCLTFLLNFT